ncbi:uncharacterized protein LOC143279383 [Babylonia areolata]|uniref:uncharacterized protein LOC143279383 n=1 Tax=Babylonia areolata TaxID=304850 RepID=UPI003FCF82BD
MAAAGGFVFRHPVLQLLLCLMLPCQDGLRNSRVTGHETLRQPLQVPATTVPNPTPPDQPQSSPDVTSDVKRKHPLQCVRCKLRRRATVFLPCAHHIMCSRCADVTEKCPLCEQTILGTTESHG